MSLVSLLFQPGTAQTSIGAISLDALTEESTTLASQVTSYAVEDGAPITDHVSLESEQLSLSGWVTGASAFGGGPGRMIEAKQALRDLHAQRQAVTVVTGLDTYTDMVMESCTLSRDNSAQFFQVDCQFRRIRKVALRTADIPPDKVAANDRGGKTAQKAGRTKAPAGRVAGKAPTAAQQASATAAKKRPSSTLYDLVGS